MLRKIVNINEEKCNGCGACAAACHEGAIAMINGKAKLIKDDYCDGLGDCLPACPADAITIEEREAAAYDHEAVAARMSTRLTHWPVQIRLAPVRAPYFNGRGLLIAADCCAYTYGNFHRDFMDGRSTLIGCPKLDPVNYAEKLTEMIRQNAITDITVTRMTVPCCSGIQMAVKQAIAARGKIIPLRIVTIDTDGTIANTEEA